MTASDSTAREEADRRLGIDLRERAERLITGVEAFVKLARVVAVVGVVMAMIYIGAIVVNTMQFYTLRADLSSGQSIRDTILDCVQPTGNCFKQGQERTGQAVLGIDSYTAWAVACGGEPSIAGLPLARRGPAVDACARHHMPH